MAHIPHDARILLTGATGYVGGRLLPRLEERGYRVRCVGRRPEFLHERVGPGTEIVKGDALDPQDMARALDGVHAAYYLIHSMGSRRSFVERDREAARVFAHAAREAGVRRIVYLGGLADQDADLSDHLRSRQEVGRILRESGVPTVELRSSIIIGSGSLSFEMVRALTDRLPVMITPRWVDVPAQPIAIGDVVAYLLAALEIALEGSEVFEIGGADRITYRELMREYARQRGMTRLMIGVPVLSPRLSSMWLGLVTPLYARIGRKLIDSIRHPTVVRDDRAREAFAIAPIGVAEAIAAALRNEDRAFAQTRWSDAMSSAGTRRGWAGVKFGSRIVDSRERRVDVSPERAFAPIERIGGRRGWYFATILWKLRGYVDLLLGGVGMRRGRRDPDRLVPGDHLDWWRVSEIDRPRKLLLEAEMVLPGRAWLEFEVDPDGADGARIRQTAIFDPVGLGGLVYWYTLYPVHGMIFAGMLRRIARLAESAPSEPEPIRATTPDSQ